MKIKTRLTLWFTVLVTILTAISGIISWLSIKKDLDEALVREAVSKAAQVQNVITFLAREYRDKSVPFRIEDPEVFLYLFSDDNDSLYDGVFLQLSSRLSDRVLARSPNLAGHTLPVLYPGTYAPLRLELASGRQVNIFYYSATITLGALPVANLQVGIPMNRDEELLNSLIFYEVLKVIFVFIFSIFLGLFLSNKALKPVSQITGEVETMEVKDISKRIDTSEFSGDEIGKLAETFNKLLDRISTSIIAQNRFISDASHELRSPLTAIIGHAELLEKRGETNPQVLKKSSGVIIREGERLVKLVNDLLFLARSEVRKPQKQEVNLSDIIRETVSNLQPLHSQLSFSITETNLYIYGDPDDLKRVLINLISNALSAVEENGEVKVILDKNDNQAILTVKDNGIGIPEEHLTGIFERFYRVDKARVRSKGGTGLGLAIVHEIVRNHDGNIEVKSRPGEGTAFKISFPLLRQKKQVSF